MTVTASRDPKAGADTRREYSNPPVHEVVLDLKFQRGVDSASLQHLPDAIGDRFGPAEAMHELKVITTAGASGAAPVQSSSRFVGWQFRTAERDWVLRVRNEQITLHAVRSDSWPIGRYVGWEAIFGGFAGVHAHLVEIFEDVPVQRSGLRYINRVAITEGSDLDNWFNLRFEYPASLQDLASFSINHTWREIAGHETMSASVRYGLIQGPVEDLAEGFVGILLDIDVFNYLVANAPDMADALDWFSKAHEAENALFEACVTDELRSQFDKESKDT